MSNPHEKRFGPDGSPSPTTTERMLPRGSLALAVTAVVALSFSLRIPTTAVGPLMPWLRADTSHGETFLSLLTAAPLALSLVAAPLVPRLSSRFGLPFLLGAALVLITCGTLLRSVPGDVTLLGGTVLLGTAISVGTVLLPAAIAEVPRRQQPLSTAMYTMALSLGPAIALGGTIPIMHVLRLDWRETLAVWACCSAAALVLWLAHQRCNAQRMTAGAVNHRPPPARSDGVLRDARAWRLAGFLGITSLVFYTSATWLPTVLATAGIDSLVAGGFSALVNVIAIPFAFLAPILLRDARSRRIVVPLGAGFCVIAVAILLSGRLSIVACTALGIGQGLCLGVAYGLLLRYARTPTHATSLSALTSTVGIALAAAGPFLFGAALEITSAPAMPLMGLGAVSCIQVALGVWLCFPDRQAGG